MQAAIRFKRGKQIGRCITAVALFQRKNIGRIVQNPVGIKFFNHLIAKPDNIKRVFTDKVFEALFGLRRTSQPAGATANGLIFFTHRVGAAFRTHIRKNKRYGIGRPFIEFHFNHLRNHVAGALNHHRIADAKIFTFDFVFVVQSGVRNNHTANIHRL